MAINGGRDVPNWAVLALFLAFSGLLSMGLIPRLNQIQRNTVDIVEVRIESRTQLKYIIETLDEIKVEMRRVR